MSGLEVIMVPLPWVDIKEQMTLKNMSIYIINYFLDFRKSVCQLCFSHFSTEINQHYNLWEIEFFKSASTASLRIPGVLSQDITKSICSWSYSWVGCCTFHKQYFFSNQSLFYVSISSWFHDKRFLRDSVLPHWFLSSKEWLDEKFDGAAPLSAGREELSSPFSM